MTPVALLFAHTVLNASLGAGLAEVNEPQELLAMAETRAIELALRREGRRADADVLQAFYGPREFDPAFATSTGLTDAGLILSGRLREGVAHGLDPDLLGLDEVRAAIDALDAADAADRPEAAAAAEVALADALVRLADELRYANPANRPAGAPDTWRRDALLELLGASPSALDELLDALPPTLPAYVALVGALDRYRAIQEAGTWRTYDGPIDASADPEQVLALRDRLAREGYLEASMSATFDDALSEAVFRFQVAHHVDPEAEDAAAQTIAALQVPIEERVAQLIVTLDRMRDSRWGADAPGEAVWVNVAGFYAEVWEHDNRLFRTRAVVGRLEGGGRNHTPLFSDVMERIELNPMWYPPPRLAASLSENAARGIVRQGGRLVQLPGPDNALGRVKFLFPNSHDVYLHDTSHRELFAESVRAYSSGCVRIDQPLQLATLLISRDQARDYDEVQAWIDEIMETTNTERVDLAHPLPVHIEYFTAYVADDGIVEFYGDIYGLDRPQIRQVQRRRDVTWVE